jgi:hypothetical protein
MDNNSLAEVSCYKPLVEIINYQSFVLPWKTCERSSRSPLQGAYLLVDS